MADPTMEQRVLMLEASVRSLQKTVASQASLAQAVVDGVAANQQMLATSQQMFASIEELRAISQRQSQHVRAIEALFLEGVRRLSAGGRVEDLHDELQQWRDEQEN
jgi:hypothetical protein